MTALRRAIALWLALAGLAPAAGAQSPGRFEKVWCLRYATAPSAPLSVVHAGAPPDARLDLSFAMCVAKGPAHVVVLDAGYVDPALGKPFGATGWTE
jgi:hypothetical protein